MVSLTPQSRKAEVTDQAMNEGTVNGLMVLIPSVAALYAGMQNERFRKLTNWQSRTAMTIMPALFVFALTSELKLSHRMHEVAEETEHAIKSVEWAEKQHLPVAARSSSSSSSNKTYSSLTEEEKMKQREELRILYRQSVLNSGVRLVETPELQPYHQAANYIQTNPFKVIAAIGVPSVALIFHGRNNKEHLNFQLKILHTRVFGQFAVICTLLGVMGLKEMMDQRGRYVTEAEVEHRVRAMEKTREALMDRLAYQASQQPTALLLKKELERKRKQKDKDGQTQQEEKGGVISATATSTTTPER